MLFVLYVAIDNLTFTEAEITLRTMAQYLAHMYLIENIENIFKKSNCDRDF
jgi:hypothetical protein